MGYGGKLRFLKQFGWAFSGMKRAFFAERHLQFHAAAAIVVLIFAFVLGVSVTETLILLIVIGVVIALELINTAIEHVVDLITEDWHALAKLAKDVSAGAVLFFAIVAVVIGIIIFSPYLLAYF